MTIFAMLASHYILLTMKCGRFPDLKMKSFFMQSVMMEKYLFLFIFSRMKRVKALKYPVCTLEFISKIPPVKGRKISDI